jgi:hypothetical protein
LLGAQGVRESEHAGWFGRRALARAFAVTRQVVPRLPDGGRGATCALPRFLHMALGPSASAPAC